MSKHQWSSDEQKSLGTSQTHSFVHMCDYSIHMLQQDKVDHICSSQMTASLMISVALENTQPDSFIHMDDSTMTLVPQNPAGPTMWKKHHCMHTQHEQLEALLSYTMFPDKDLQKELALKPSLPESAVKAWFRNWWVKLKKQQQQKQLSLKQPNQILPAENMPTSPTASTSPSPAPQHVSDFCSYILPQGALSHCWESHKWWPNAGSSVTKARVLSSCFLLYNTCDIAQIMELKFSGWGWNIQLFFPLSISVSLTHRPRLEE